MKKIQYSLKKTVLATALTVLGVLSAVSSQAATINVTRCVDSVNSTMSDGASVTFWRFGTGGGMCTGTLPGPVVEVGVYPAGSGRPTPST